MEEWKDIKGYEGLYQVSNLGRVKSVKRNIIMKNALEEYQKIQLNHSKHYYIHRLVAEAFIPNPNNLPQVNHINGDKYDNRVENLEWCNQSNNMKHAYKEGLQVSQKGSEHHHAKLTEKQVLEIRALKGKVNQYVLAERYNISQSIISGIMNDKRWKHI